MESEVEISSPPGNRTLKCKSKMLKLNEGAILSALSSTVKLDSVDSISDSYKGKDDMDLNDDDYESADEYSILQSHFDFIDFPAGIEAPIPWLLDSIKMKSKPDFAMQDIASATGFVQSRKRSSTSSSLQAQRDALKVRSVKKPLKASCHMSSGSGGFSSHSRHDQLGSLKVPGTRPYFAHSSSTQVGAGTTSSFSWLPTDAVYPQVIDPQIVGAPEHIHVIPMEDMKLDQDSGKRQKSLNVAESSCSMFQPADDDDVRGKYQNFKKFDIVEDHSDHHYSTLHSAMEQSQRNWAKKIQEEWRILEKDLPDMIFVRVYEARVDLLRAVIIGAEGTPYHDGLFFFDVCFPRNYPNVPPDVHYLSGGLRINPNLYEDGTVCLSLLNTWFGVVNEKWIPGSSTMLQVLVSIQGLILNAKPYFNEPGLASSSGSVYGENCSLEYNEHTLILSLKTMVYTMKQPPKHFEKLVIGHFRDRAHGILTACKAYTEGARVGCIVDKGKKRRSPIFKNELGRYINTLVGAFKRIGAEDVEEFLSKTQKVRVNFGI